MLIKLKISSKDFDASIVDKLESVSIFSVGELFTKQKIFAKLLTDSEFEIVERIKNGQQNFDLKFDLKDKIIDRVILAKRKEIEASKLTFNKLSAKSEIISLICKWVASSESIFL